VQEERRQHRHGDDVRPIEHPVEPVEPAAERERQHTEERHAQPEEVEGGGIGWTPQADRHAHQQGKDGRCGQEEVEGPMRFRDWPQPQLAYLPRPGT
jgi:hypothetical protein